MGRTTRAKHVRSPLCESLETRRLLDGKIRLVKNGALLSDDDFKRAVLQLQQNVPVSDRRIAYTTPDGTNVVVTLYGKGTLKGTHVRDDGALEVVFNKTNNETRIIAAAHGPKGRNTELPLAGIHDADTNFRSNSPSGVDPVAAVQFAQFKLVDDGFINLMGGVLQLNLKAVGRRASIYLQQGVAPTSTAQTGTVIATGGASVGGVTPVTSTTVPTTTTTTAPQGIEIRINRVDAGPTETPPFGHPQVYSVDPATQRLIRFDTVTGDPTLAVAIPGLTDTSPPVGVAFREDQELVLVGNNDQVLAFDSVTGAPVGSFTTSNLAGQGFTQVDGIGSSRTRTLLTDTGGIGVRIDVGESLKQGQAVQVDGSFVPQREFVFNGDATGLAGSSTIYTMGAAHFDTFQPNLYQFGVMALAPFLAGFTETSRTVIPGIDSPNINAGSDGLNPNPFFGFGTIDSQLARLGPATNGTNVIALVNPSTQAPTGAVVLHYANQLYGLSESVHPELRPTSLIDINGAMKRFVGKQIHGLVLNTRGTVNLVAVHTAVDSAFIGRPLNHVEFEKTRNVQLISTARGINGKVQRGDVTIEKSLLPTGPLVIP